MGDKSYPLLKAAAIATMEESRNVHPFNEKAIRHTRSIGDLLGLSQIGIHLVRLESGNESTQFHFHHCDSLYLSNVFWI